MVSKGMMSNRIESKARRVKEQRGKRNSEKKERWVGVSER